jgi:hypothetical protein
MTENYMTLHHFAEERKSHESCLQFWIQSDEDTLVLDCDPDHGEITHVSVSVITTKIFEHDQEGRKSCQAWGVPFKELAKFVDAVRAITTK